MNRRRWTTAAVMVVCALSALAVPAHTAYAAPLPPPSPGASPSTGGSASASAVPRPLEEVRKEIDALYRQAASATDAYNLAKEQTEKQSARIARLSRSIIDGQLRIEDLRKRAGAAAREQYRGGGIPESARLVLTSDPELFLDGAGRLLQGQKATRDLLAELERAQADLESYTREAGVQWDRLEANRVKQADAKKRIESRITAAKQLESRLAAAERARLLRLEQEEERRAQTAWLGSGALKDAGAGTAATEAGRKAIRFAEEQLGKPYVWGAEGPESYDCSGLTSQAWLAAGRAIPRTSQEQWRLLPHVEIRDMRPGDLIIYHEDASHVGLYIGNGSIIHAPRPGRNVTVTGAGSMTILGVVRPDDGGDPSTGRGPDSER
ncbi:NlpC/P60 family protein [Streptomyces sp. LP05-1]|uniref:NlpC/P60 family protein n=1 Tax=Streptomyces pyxinae TaxID=2970734 RepID=A0ABT2CQ35_9ACTN|nr:C40 family peptidase [Streptomyces sp. LP05-1]MCS0638776.1 NlpC/P60 family protein [Streptomyces sp. LP05-1]